MALKNRSFLEIGRQSIGGSVIIDRRWKESYETNTSRIEGTLYIGKLRGWKFPLLVLFSSDASLFEMITRWKLFLLPTFIGSIDIRFHVDTRIQPMRQKKNRGRVTRCIETLERNFRGDTRREILLVSFRSGALLAASFLVNSASLRLMSIELVSSSVDRVNRSAQCWRD